MSGVYSYDLIADVYATDMGRSMPFDDIGWYASVAARRAGRVLELGCGTGRITIALAARRLEVVGVDRSLRMLKRARLDANARGVELALVQSDLRSLALRGTFATILLPYSLITYLIDESAAVDLLRRLATLLAPNGVVVLDAFVPKPVESFSDFRRDYRREHGDGFLEREKRIAVQADGTNVIERRYRILDASNQVRDEFVTRDRIRPYDPAALHRIASAADFVVIEEAHDYGARSSADSAQFRSLVLTR